GAQALLPLVPVKHTAIEQQLQHLCRQSRCCRLSRLRQLLKAGRGATTGEEKQESRVNPFLLKHAQGAGSGPLQRVHAFVLRHLCGASHYFNGLVGRFSSPPVHVEHAQRRPSSPWPPDALAAQVTRPKPRVPKPPTPTNSRSLSPASMVSWTEDQPFSLEGKLSR